jgi:L-rhamnose mutarotase
MIRKAFKMKVFADKKEDYIQRHNPIWDELKAVLQAHDVSNYSIFMDPETEILFGYAEIQSEEQWNAIANTAMCKKWWAFMSDCMETNSDQSPVSIALTEVFHLD